MKKKRRERRSLLRISRAGRTCPSLRGQRLAYGGGLVTPSHAQARMYVPLVAAQVVAEVSL